MKIKNQSCKWSHKCDGIRVGKIRTFPFSNDSACNSIVYDLVKTRLLESEAEVEEQTNHNAHSLLLLVTLTKLVFT